MLSKSGQLHASPGSPVCRVGSVHRLSAMLLHSNLSLTGISELASMWVRLAPNGTDPGLFKIRFRYIQNVAKSDLKKSRICPVWGQSGPLCDQICHLWCVTSSVQREIIRPVERVLRGYHGECDLINQSLRLTRDVCCKD